MRYKIVAMEDFPIFHIKDSHFPQGEEIHLTRKELDEYMQVTTEYLHIQDKLKRLYTKAKREKRKEEVV